MASLQDKSSLLKVYLSAFQRAPELEGLNYWLREVDFNGLDATLKTIFSLPVVQQVYAASQSNADFVTAIYNNVFNKSPDTDGLNYWVGELSSLNNRGLLVLNMINAGLSTSDGTPGKDVIVNRFTHASQAVSAQETAAVSLDPAYLAAQYQSITGNASSVTQVSASIATKIQETQQTGYNPATDPNNAKFLNDGVVDLFTKQQLGTDGALTTAQLQFLSNLWVARELTPAKLLDGRSFTPDSKGGQILDVILNGQDMADLRVHIGDKQLEQIDTYTVFNLDPIVYSIVEKYITPGDAPYFEALFSEDITLAQLPPALQQNILAAAAEAHQHFSQAALVGYQQAIAGTLDGWVML
ncbi:DUF4214 domain-containing protein [Noviherbaspirillum sp.]|uniref:DUF4214 domain-containing protein n=1 Tax=Noviherbaspirillum sp. TaxID=1926288 RepID=UPI002D30C97E|nr:DUF4214 domain-containing protein [Noviherbaspirillum sp.]HZW23476.1 DUF4214 domain-containing protein [Noviherbaspirillum sp.]